MCLTCLRCYTIRKDNKQFDVFYMIGGVGKKICHVFDVFGVFDFVGLFQGFGQRMMCLVCKT